MKKTYTKIEKINVSKKKPKKKVETWLSHRDGPYIAREWEADDEGRIIPSERCR